MSDLSQDQRLVQAALGDAKGSRRQLAERLLDTIQREVAFVLRRLAVQQRRDPRQEVSDLVQDVLVSLFERDCQELRRWDPERGRSLDSFVRLVARRKVARVLGQRRGNPWANESVDPQLIETDGDDADLTVRQLEQRNKLGTLLDALYAQMSARDLQLFDLLFVQDQEPGEVAGALGMTRGAVNAWCYRTRKLARACALDNQSTPGVSTSNSAGARGP